LRRHIKAASAVSINRAGESSGNRYESRRFRTVTKQISRTKEILLKLEGSAARGSDPPRNMLACGTSGRAHSQRNDRTAQLLL